MSLLWPYGLSGCSGAASLTGKVPCWGNHLDANRHGTHLISVQGLTVESFQDWGMLGYFVGDVVQERIPVLVGKFGQPDLVRHKHFGAAAASSGGVELYHLVGITPEAPTLDVASGGRQPAEVFTYGRAERQKTYDAINASARETRKPAAPVAV